MPYYAISRGREVGIVTTWEECKSRVSGFSGAIYKKFNDLEEAKMFVKSPEKVVAISKIGLSKRKQFVNDKDKDKDKVKESIKGKDKDTCEVKTIEISGNIPIGYVNYDGSINCSKNLEEKLIPISIKDNSHITNTNRANVVYWTLNEIYCKNIKNAKLYSLLWS